MKKLLLCFWFVGQTLLFVGGASLPTQKAFASSPGEATTNIGEWIGKSVTSGASRFSQKFDRLVDAFVEGLGKAFTDNLNKFLFNNYLIPRFVRWWGQKVPPYQYDRAQTLVNYPIRVDDLILDLDTKIQVRAFVKNLRYAERNQKPLPKMVLYGPPGVGKTQIARAIVNEGSFIIKAFTGGELSRLSHDQLQHIMNFINKPYKKRIILFIDEAETLFRESYGRRTPQLQAFMAATGGRSENFTVIAATNYAEQFDEATFQRFDYKVNIQLPKAEQRVEIFKHYVKRNLKSSPSVTGFKEVFSDELFMNRFVEVTAGLAPRDLEQVAELIVAEAEYFDGKVQKSKMIYRVEDLKKKQGELVASKDAANRKRREDARAAYMERKMVDQWDDKSGDDGGHDLDS